MGVQVLRQKKRILLHGKKRPKNRKHEAKLRPRSVPPPEVLYELSNFSISLSGVYKTKSCQKRANFLTSGRCRSLRNDNKAPIILQEPYLDMFLVCLTIKFYAHH